MSLGVVASSYVEASAFKPSDIEDVALWFSAEAITGLTDDATIAAADLDDLSGQANHPVSISNTPKYRATQGRDGGPAIFCSGMHYFTLPNFMSGSAAGEVMMTIRSNTGSQGSSRFGTTGADSHYPYGANVYEDFGSAFNRYEFTPTLSVYQWRIYNVWSAANDWGARIDGVTQRTVNPHSVGWHATPLFGNVWNGDGLWFGGFVVCKGRLFTAEERTELYNYLNAFPSGGDPS